MNTNEILNKPACREMDCAIARDIMKLEESHEAGWWWINGMTEECPHYSTDTSSAWEVRDKIKSKPDTICVDIWNENEKEYCNIHTKTGVYFSGECETASLAICRAALLSTMNEE